MSSAWGLCSGRELIRRDAQLILAGNSWPVLSRKMKKIQGFPTSLEVTFLGVQELLATALCCEFMLRQLPMMTSKVPFWITYYQDKNLYNLHSIPTYLMLRLTIQNVLLLLCDHLPSDSCLLVTGSWLLSIVFDLTGFCVSKSFVAQLLTKIGVKNSSCALMAKALFLLFSLYELHFEIYQGTQF